MRDRILYTKKIFKNHTLLKAAGLEGINLYIILQSYAEDSGIYKSDHEDIFYEIGSLREKPFSMTPEKIAEIEQKLIDANFIVPYMVGNERYCWIPDVVYDQNLKRPKRTKDSLLPPWLKYTIQNKSTKGGNSYSVTEYVVDDKELKKVCKEIVLPATKDKPAKATSANPNDKIIEEVITHLNKVTGKDFGLTTTAYTSAINARINDGATLVEMKAVIDIKVKQWLGDEEMDKHLTPKTLFRPSNYDGYKNELSSGKGNGAQPSIEKVCSNCGEVDPPAMIGSLCEPCDNKRLGA